MYIFHFIYYDILIIYILRGYPTLTSLKSLLGMQEK